ncbi:DUF6524 family protein [Azospirillum halopraeferens]|uniref:DUF6524 family protein n=1 Tax=Azospirillum halopraeferens TaxID=34010 RepID=UPI0004103C47|nr:DUF6524 family protein [Azospirillum halopraeferens]
MAAAAGRFKLSDFIIRWLFLFAMITATYNPTGYSYVDWLFAADTTYLAVKLFIGMTLIILYGFILGMAGRALKGMGVFLAILFFASLTWALESQDLLPGTRLGLMLLIQAFLAATLAAGLSLAILRQNVAGHTTYAEK